MLKKIWERSNIFQLKTIVESLRQEEHYECEDCFYSCPRHKDYCGVGEECNCGLEEINQKIDDALKILEKL